MPRPKNDFLSCMWWHWQKIHRRCSNRQLQRMRRNWPTPLRCLWWCGRSRTSRFSTGTSGKGLQRPSIFVSISGSLAKFAAMRRASSRVSRWVAERRCDAPMCPQVGDKRKSLALARNDVNDPQQKSELVPDLGNRVFNFRQLLRGCQPTIAAHRA
jgi:hypothetical protein